MTEAEIVVALRAAGCIFAEDEARLLMSAAESGTRLEGMLARRLSGVPLEHVVGFVEFCGFRMHVAPGVFVPRRRTELLVEQGVGFVHDTAAVGNLGYGERRTVVVDMCCGSGAIGAAVTRILNAGHIGVDLYAVDVEPAAVACARVNVTPLGGLVLEGDLFAPLPLLLRGGVDLLVANAPYVPTASIALMPAEARLHEPHVALDGGADGLDVQRRVVGEAPEWLSPRGHLLVETSAAQAPYTASAFASAGLHWQVMSEDERDATVVVGRLRG